MLIQCQFLLRGCPYLRVLPLLISRRLLYSIANTRKGVGTAHRRRKEKEKEKEEEQSESVT